MEKNYKERGIFGFRNRDKDVVEKELDLYERRRKQEVDEAISEYRREEKNKAVTETQKFRDERAEIADKRAKDVEEYSAKKLERETTLAKLDGEIVARKAVEATQESHRKLTADARKENLTIQLKAVEDVAEAKVSAATAAVTKAEAETATLRSTVATFIAEGGKNITSLITALGAAAEKDHSTKVIGLGVPAVNAEKKA